MPDDVMIEDGGAPEVNTPPVDPKQLAREVVAEVMGAQKPMSDARESALERTVAKLAAQGVPKDAIMTVVEIFEAYGSDKAANAAEGLKADQWQRYNASLFAMAEEAIGEFEDKIDKFRVVKPGLIEEMSRLMEKDPAFADAKEAIKQGRFPSKKAFAKAADKAIDEFYGGDFKKKDAPINLKSSKPQAAAEDDDPLAGVDKDSRKMYLAIVNAFNGDEKRAKEVFKQTQASRR